MDGRIGSLDLLERKGPGNRRDRRRVAARMTQHSSLSSARWAQFSLDQQILMIGNEMNRAKRSIDLKDWHNLHREYERVLRLVDLTLEVQGTPRSAAGVAPLAWSHFRSPCCGRARN